MQKTKLTLAQVMRGEIWAQCADEFHSKEFDARNVVNALDDVENEDFDPIALDGHGITLPC